MLTLQSDSSPSRLFSQLSWSTHVLRNQLVVSLLHCPLPTSLSMTCPFREFRWSSTVINALSNFLSFKQEPPYFHTSSLLFSWSVLCRRGSCCVRSDYCSWIHLTVWARVQHYHQLGFMDAADCELVSNTTIDWGSWMWGVLLGVARWVGEEWNFIRSLGEEYHVVENFWEPYFFHMWIEYKPRCTTHGLIMIKSCPFPVSRIRITVRFTGGMLDTRRTWKFPLPKKAGAWDGKSQSRV